MIDLVQYFLIQPYARVVYNYKSKAYLIISPNPWKSLCDWKSPLKVQICQHVTQWKDVDEINVANCLFALRLSVLFTF